MPQYFAVALLALLSISSADGASLTVEQQKTSVLMRRDKTEMSESNSASTEAESGPEYLCNDDYVEGPPSADACTDVEHHHHIQTPEMCLQAATEMRLRTLESMELDHHQRGKLSFYTPYLDWDLHPKGCYVDACDESGDSDKCVYFNKVATAPTPPTGTSLTGTIVCYRQRLVLGTANSDGAQASCPGSTETTTGEYTPIGGIVKCQEASKCLGYAANSQPEFIVDALNRTLHDYYPQGCFIHKIPNIRGTVDSVSFAPQRNKVDGSHWTPGAPHGTPICIVTNPARTVEWANAQHGRAAHEAGSANETTVQNAAANSGSD